jgi:hypothetical protein
VARRTPGGDDERIGQGRAAFQLDGHNVLGLVIIERSADPLEQSAVGRIEGLVRRLLQRSLF